MQLKHIGAVEHIYASVTQGRYAALEGRVLCLRSIQEWQRHER